MGTLPTHALVEEGVWHHLHGLGDLDRNWLSTGVDSLLSKQTNKYIHGIYKTDKPLFVLSEYTQTRGSALNLQLSPAALTYEGTTSHRE